MLASIGGIGLERLHALGGQRAAILGVGRQAVHNGSTRKRLGCLRRSIIRMALEKETASPMLLSRQDDSMHNHVDVISVSIEKVMWLIARGTICCVTPSDKLLP